MYFVVSLVTQIHRQLPLKNWPPSGLWHRKWYFNLCHCSSKEERSLTWFLVLPSRMAKHPDLPGTERSPGMWNFLCWNREDPGKSGWLVILIYGTKSWGVYLLHFSCVCLIISSLRMNTISSLQGFPHPFLPFISYPPNVFYTLWPQTLMETKIII